MGSFTWCEFAPETVPNVDVVELLALSGIADRLRRAGVRPRKITNTTSGGSSADQSSPFNRIGRLTERYENAGVSWSSLDTEGVRTKSRLREIGLLNLCALKLRKRRIGTLKCDVLVIRLDETNTTGPRCVVAT